MVEDDKKTEEVKTKTETSKKKTTKKVKSKKTTEKKTKRVRKRKKKSVVLSRGKRKRAVARAYITEGSGIVRVNSRLLDTYFNNDFIVEMVREPLKLVGSIANKVDIRVNVYGGGIMGQAQAVRNAIAVGLVNYTGDEKLKEKFLEYDRFMIVEDSRRTEPKKYLGPKARARKQKSYR